MSTYLKQSLGSLFGTSEVDGKRVALTFGGLTCDEEYAVLMAMMAMRQSNVSAQVANWGATGEPRRDLAGRDRSRMNG